MEYINGNNKKVKNFNVENFLVRQSFRSKFFFS